MISVFYDLETSDSHYLGQILNYSFIVVDESFNIIDELSGLVSVNRLQLPSPGAIQANKIDIIQHQKIASHSEVEAMRHILEFLNRILERADSDVCLIGFNSKKFDLNYLRTSIIRNGLNPYLKSKRGHKYINCDLLHVLRKLVTINQEFALISLKEAPSKDEISRSLSLEHISTQFKLLSGSQSHESREDVLLTISLAKLIKERFAIDVRTFKSYEGARFHNTARTGKVYVQRVPEYDITLNRDFSIIPVTLLDFKSSGALWIDLKAYSEGKERDSIFWRNTNDGLLFVDEVDGNEFDNYIEYSSQAIVQFKNITLDNFFDTSTCDIEQDIYRLSFSDRDALFTAIWSNDTSLLKRSNNKDIQELFTRYKLKRYLPTTSEALKAEQLLEKYAIYRYGGGIKLNKREYDDLTNSPKIDVSLKSYIESLQEMMKSASNDMKKIFESLLCYYAQSDILRICGSKLISEEQLAMIRSYAE